VLAILSSLAVALIVTPALSLVLLPKAAARQGRDPFILRSLKAQLTPPGTM